MKTETWGHTYISKTAESYETREKIQNWVAYYFYYEKPGNVIEKGEHGIFLKVNKDVSPHDIKRVVDSCSNKPVSINRNVVVYLEEMLVGLKNPPVFFDVRIKI